MIPISRRARKIKINVDSWARTSNKRGRDSGKEYLSSYTQQQVPARVVGPPCRCNCFDRVGPANINDIFENFWNIGNYDLQNNYLSKLVSSTVVKRSRVGGSPSRKLSNINYTVIFNNKVHNV